MGLGATTIGRVGRAVSKIISKILQMEDEKTIYIF
jgi:hypothetical protein